MKATINGYRYDTANAIRIAEAIDGSRWTQWQAALYRTPKAERYFLAGEGGPMTIFAKAIAGGGMGWQSGQRIIPLTTREAASWAAVFCGTERIGDESDELEALYERDAQEFVAEHPHVHAEGQDGEYPVKGDA